MKKILLILLSCALGFYLSAETETIDGIEWTYQVSNGEAQIYKDYWSPAIPSSIRGAITIPSTIGGFSVTSIGDSAFRSCSSLTSVTIPSSVTSIGVCAFLFCTGLTSVTIPSSVTSIEPEAFRGCSSLTSVTIPSSLTSIGRDAFLGCSSLTSVTIPEGVTSIDTSAFYGCSSLTSFVVDSTNQHYSAINNLLCSKDGKTLVACPRGLTSVTIPSSVTTIGSSAFYNCTNLWRDSNGVQYESDAKVVLIDVPTSLIGEFVIPNSVRFIYSNAFSNCSNLTSVTISASVTSIGGDTFDNCTSLASVIFEGAPLQECYNFNECNSLERIMGYYFAQYASEWEKVIAEDGTWNGLAMMPIEDDPDVINDVKLTFDANGGEGSQTLTQAYGTELIAPTVTREGYTFVGWSPSVPATVPVADKIYVAQWQANQYTIAYSANGGSGTMQQTSATYGESITLPNATFVKEGFYFRGWATEVGGRIIYPDGATVSNLTTEQNGVVNLFAVWGSSNATPEEFFVYSHWHDTNTGRDVVNITGLQGLYPEDIIVPTTIEGVPVSHIGFDQVTVYEQLKSITFPDADIQILHFFEECLPNLESVFFKGCHYSIGVSWFPETAIGYYPARYAEEWLSEIDENGRFWNLKMQLWEDEVVTPEDILIFSVINDEVVITGLKDSDYSGALIIPSILGGCPVTSIGNSAFSGCTGLTSVTIPEGVVTIEGYAFGECSGLTSVTIPSSLRNVRWHAFAGVASERNVYISDLAAWCQICFEDTECNPCYGEGNLYLNDTLITDLVIPEGVTEINNSTFESYKKLTSVTIPEGVTVIGSNAFRGCENLTSVRIPSSVTEIGYAAFVECPNLESVTFSGAPLSGYSDGWIFSDATGYYLPKHAEAWAEVINEDGKWCGLTMRCMEAGKLFTLTFEANGGEGGTSVTQDYGSSLIAPTVTREGYTFIGWSPEVPTTVPAKNATYTAQWRANQYTQTFDAAGGEGGTSVTQDYGSSLAAPIVTREGYTFIGWSPNVPASIPSTDATYVAQWRINQYTMTFDVAGGEGGTSVTQDYGSSLIAPPVTREGYTFVGWSPNVPATIPSTDATYVAQWRINQYTITFDAAGGEGGTSVTQDYGSSLTAPTVTREGCTFVGWSPEVPTTVSAANVTYMAQWQINQYTITFDAAGGEGGVSVTQDYGSSLSAPTVTREGYTFTSWSPTVPTTVPATNATYTAQWQINQYTITFDAAGGEGGTSVTQAYGSPLTAPTVIREGYTFIGWSPEVSSITPAVNTTYVAQWAKVYDVTINCKGDGTVSGEGFYQPGESITLTATPSDGSVFCGWDGYKKTAGETISFVMPEEDVVLTAYFANASALDVYLSTHGNVGGDDLDSLVEAEIAKRDLHTADEMKEMVVDTPVIEAKNGVVTIRLQVKDGAANEVMDGGEVSVEITPKAGEKAGFYKFVVPNQQ